MSVSVEHPPGTGVVVVTLSGEHDVATAGLVRRVLGELSRSAQTVVLDLEQCLFVDSTIMGAFVGALKRIGSSGGRMVVVNAEGVVAKALHLTGLESLLAPAHDEAFMEVLEQLRAPRDLVS